METKSAARIWWQEVKDEENEIFRNFVGYTMIKSSKKKELFFKIQDTFDKRFNWTWKISASWTNTHTIYRFLLSVNRFLLSKFIFHLILSTLTELSRKGIHSTIHLVTELKITVESRKKKCHPYFYHITKMCSVIIKIEIVEIFQK